MLMVDLLGRQRYLGILVTIGTENTQYIQIYKRFLCIQDQCFNVTY